MTRPSSPPTPADSTGDPALDARLDHHRDTRRGVAMADGLLNQVQSHRRAAQRMAERAEIEAALAIHEAHARGVLPIRRHGGVYGLAGFGTGMRVTFRPDPIEGAVGGRDPDAEPLSAEDEAELDRWSKRGPVKIRPCSIHGAPPTPPAPELQRQPAGGAPALSVARHDDDGRAEP